MRLTARQKEELLRIVAGAGQPEFGAAGDSRSPSSRALENKGLIRTFERHKALGGDVSVTWYLAEPTEAGWVAAEKMIARRDVARVR